MHENNYSFINLLSPVANQSKKWNPTSPRTHLTNKPTNENWSTAEIWCWCSWPKLPFVRVLQCLLNAEKRKLQIHLPYAGISRTHLLNHSAGIPVVKKGAEALQRIWMFNPQLAITALVHHASRVHSCILPQYTTDKFLKPHTRTLLKVDAQDGCTMPHTTYL